MKWTRRLSNWGTMWLSLCREFDPVARYGCSCLVWVTKIYSGYDHLANVADIWNTTDMPPEWEPCSHSIFSHNSDRDQKEISYEMKSRRKFQIPSGYPLWFHDEKFTNKFKIHTKMIFFEHLVQISNLIEFKPKIRWRVNWDQIPNSHHILFSRKDNSYSKYPPNKIVFPPKI